MRPRTFSLNLFYSLLFVFVVIGLVGCDGCNKKLPALESNANAINQHELNWMQVLDDLPEGVAQTQRLEHLNNADTLFWPVWCQDMMFFGQATDTNSLIQLDAFIDQYEEVLQSIRRHSGSDIQLSEQSNRLQLAFARMKEFDDNISIPEVYWAPYWFTLNGVAMNRTYAAEELVVVGLNFFLGDTLIYNRMPPNLFPSYQINRMTPENMANEAFTTWLTDVYFSRDFSGKNPSEVQVIDLWFAWAKSMHFAARGLHDAKNSFQSYQELDDAFFAELMNWTVDEWQWALDNEENIWGEMQQQQRLFSADRRDINAWFQPGPFTRIGNIPQDCPDRLGIFLAWRAVQQAMELSDDPKNLEEDLLTSQDPSILLGAYKP